MRHPTSFVNKNFLLYPESTKLGRIVLNPQEPFESYYDLYPDLEKLKGSGGDIHVTPGVDLSCTFNESKKKSLRGALLQLFSGTSSSTIEGQESLEGETKRYILGNAEQLFRKACGGEKVRDWLQENVIKPKVDAYMMVAYHTITNPKIVNGNQLQRETTFQADDALAANTAAPGLPGVARVKKVQRNHRRCMQKLSVDGEGIFAVQYRKVVYKLDRWYSDNQVGLRESKWYMYLHIRGQDDQGHYSVETDLGDPAEFEPESEDSDDEDVPKPPEFYFVKTGDVGEGGEGGEVEEEFIFFHETHAPDEEEEEEENE